MLAQSLRPITKSSSDRVSRILIVLGALGMVACLVIGVPRNAGPDEAQHIARGAALVRGQLNGEPDSPPSPYVWFTLPWWIGQPDPACYAFNPTQTAGCASVHQPTGALTIRWLSKTGSYPPTAHILAGLATLLPGGAATSWIARLLNAAIPVGVILMALRCVLSDPRRRWLGAGVLIALNPAVWFFVAVVNPSGWLAAGSLAMWAATVSRPEDPTTVNNRAWLFAIGFSLATLARFDGLAFSVVVLVLATLWGTSGMLSQIVRAKAPLVVMTGAAIINAGWTVHYGQRQWLFGGRGLEVATLTIGIVGLVAVVRSSRLLRAVDRLRCAAVDRPLLIAALFPAVPTAIFFLQSESRHFPYAASVGNTGESILEGIGVLGWVDTRIPETAFFLQLMAIGLIVGLAVLVGGHHRKALLVATCFLVVSLQWFLQMSLTYWHGRYLFSLTVGIPLMAASIVGDSTVAAMGQRAGTLIGATTWVVWNLGFAQTIRRFAVGSVGVMDPTAWDNYETFVSKSILLAAFAACSGALVAGVLLGTTDRHPPSNRSAPINGV